MTRKKTFALVIAVLIALLTATVVLAATVVVDPFDTGAQDFGVVIPAGGGTVGAGQSIAATVLGNERDLVITATAPAIAQGETYFARVLAGSIGRLSLSADPDVQGVATVTWDGADGNPFVLNPTGLGGADLTGGGTNNAFHLVILFDDLPVKATLRVYSSAANWSQATANLPGGILSGSRVDLTVPFSTFTTGGGAGATFSSAGAVVLIVDASASPGADVTLDLVELDSTADFGDLPNGYGTTLASNGPRHQILTGLRLGGNIDAEADGFPSVNANGDDLNQAPPNDEDGVVRPATPKWTVGNPPGNGGVVRVTVKGCDATVTSCFVNGWIDWNNNGSFADAGDRIVTATVLGDGVYQYSFPIPAGTTVNNGTFYARFRLCGGVSGANDCGTPNGASLTGEVEDYQWGFGPLAVTLNSLQAQPTTTSPVLPVALIAFSAAALMGVVFFTRRGRKKSA